MFCVVVLQNCMGFVDGETVSCNETCVEYDDDDNVTEEVSINVEEALYIKEEFSIKVEEAVDIKDEIPETISFPPIKIEHEVRLWVVCELVAADALSHLLHQKGNC
jgi:hypothetical protein